MKNWKQFNEGLFLSAGEWEDKMSDFIKNEGAILSNDERYVWTLLTKFGNLSIRFDIRKGYPTIFMKFEYPELSKELSGINKFSGKWNIHEINMTELFRLFKMRINEVKLTPEEKAANKYNL